jgi:hypothetical protein
MHVKFVIFGVILVLLVAGMYGSSASYVCAEPIWTTIKCTTQSFPDGSKSETCCGQTDKPKQMGEECRTCTIDKDGDRTCGSWEPARTTFGSNLNEKLADLNSPDANDTKVPNTDLLTDESLAESQNTTDGNDITKPPKDLGGLNDEDLSEPDQ